MCCFNKVTDVWMNMYFSFCLKFMKYIKVSIAWKIKLIEN